MGLYIFLCGWKDLYENGHTILLATKDPFDLALQGFP